MTETKLLSWDSAVLPETAEYIVAYLEAAFEGGDPVVIGHALSVVIQTCWECPHETAQPEL